MRTFFLLALLGTSFIAFSQQEGTIIYEMKIDVHAQLPPDQEHLKTLVPRYRTSMEQVWFNDHELMAKPYESDDEEDAPAPPQGGFMRMNFKPNYENYANAQTNATTSQNEFMGKYYLIQDSIRHNHWTMGERTRKILNYTCKEAYRERKREERGFRMALPNQPNTKPDTTKATVNKMDVITVWYAPDLRHGVGPENYLDLPGAVLAVDINNGERVTVATSVSLKKVKKNDIKVPTKGEAITREEFRKKQREAFQQQRTR